MIIKYIDIKKNIKPAATVMRHGSIISKHVNTGVTLSRFESWTDYLLCLQLYRNYLMSLHYSFLNCNKK